MCEALSEAVALPRRGSAKASYGQSNFLERIALRDIDIDAADVINQFTESMEIDAHDVVGPEPGETSARWRAEEPGRGAASLS